MFNRIRICCSFAWQLVRVGFQLMYGIWRLSALPRPIVTIFGGSRLPTQGNTFYKAHELAQRFAENNISVLTGGGSGAMEAASCGASKSVHGKSIVMGIGITNLEDKNVCVDQYFEVDRFFARKWLLTHYSSAFVIFPGGFGTLDELAELLTLIQTQKIDRSPIVLIGVEYWRDLMHWVKKETINHALISEQDLSLFTLTDDLNEAFTIVHAACFITDEKNG